MRRNSYLIFLLLIFIVISCTAKNEVHLKKEKKKVKEIKDFSHLKIQTELTEEDKKYYEAIHKKISEIGKSFAYMEPDAAKKYCLVLTKMFEDLSSRPFSREREREIERQRGTLKNMCNEDVNQPKYLYGLSKEEIDYLSDRIPESAVLIDSFSKERFNKDPIDLNVYWYDKDPKIQKEYCQKAVELKQWDHIYYLSKEAAYNGTGYLFSCLEPDHPNVKEMPDFARCRCSEAVRLVVGHWPKNILLGGELINPHAEELPESFYIKDREFIKDLILKHYGRDLDKE